MKRGINRNRKSQITIFIIIAVVIVCIIAFVFFISGKEGFSGFFPKSDVNVIKDSITECMNSNARQALKVIGLQGGYYNKPDDYYMLDWAFIPYYYKQGGFLMPTKEKIQTEIANYFDDKFIECVDEIDKKDLAVEYQKSKTSVQITKSRVAFNVDMPVTIKKGETTTIYELKQKPLIINSSLNEIYEVAQYITESHKENAQMICINCVLNMAKMRNLYVDMLAFPYDKSTTLVMISENKTYIEPYVFEFLNKY